MSRFLKQLVCSAVALAILGLANANAAPKSKQQLRRSYQSFLDKSRTPRETIRFTLAHSKWRVIDPSVDPVRTFKAGDRIVFINQGRTALYVIMGKTPIADTGARIIASHIDTPSPRLFLGNLKKSNQNVLTASAHGSIKDAHWIGRPLAIVGQVIKTDGTAIDIELGVDDDFSFFIEKRSGGEYKIITGSTPIKRPKGVVSASLVKTLHKRYGINADDLRTSELYLVPKMMSRTVGIERMMVGSHGQDDRANSFLAWRAIANTKRIPRQTAITWLVDREESGSRGRSGARTHFLELVYSYLLRSQNGTVTEAILHRAFAASRALSADTPACVNPNWPEVHEAQHGPLLGHGPAMFPGTGRRGKVGGSQAHPELIAEVLATFAKAKVPVQTAELGRVDEGGGGTIAKYLAHRGIDTVDLGICVIAMHSPFELSSVQDLWWTLRGFEAWLGN